MEVTRDNIGHVWWFLHFAVAKVVATAAAVIFLFMLRREGGRERGREGEGERESSTEGTETSGRYK